MLQAGVWHERQRICGETRGRIKPLCKTIRLPF
jgi:hypothetical protein